MNYKIKYIKSLNNISEQFRDEMDAEDHSNLNSVIGRLFCEIDDDGNMTRELAKELGKDKSDETGLLDEFKFKHCIGNNVVYFAKRKGDFYKVTWTKEGKEKSTSYNTRSVKKYINEGYWVIQGGGIMQKRIKKKIKQVEKQNEKLKQKMSDREEVYGLDELWSWYEMQVEGNTTLIEFFKKQLGVK